MGLASGEGRLAGMLYLPAEDDPSRPAVVLCNAFADERKSSCLAMVRLARRLASCGSPTLRFDYAGCGDSPGEFVDATVLTRIADINTAAECVKEQTGRGQLCLCGLRLGATLAARAAQARTDVAGLALIEPIGDGAGYIGAQVRRKLVRQMMTSGQADGHAGQADIVDLDGYALRPGTVEELRGLSLQQTTFAGPVLIVQASFNEKVRRDTAAVRSACGSAGARVDVRALVLPPFWGRIDIVDTTPLEDAVVGWLGASVG